MRCRKEWKYYPFEVDVEAPCRLRRASLFKERERIAVINTNQREKRIGEKRTMINGETCTCVAYANANHCDFMFENGDAVANTSWSYFANGELKSPTYQRKIADDIMKEREGSYSVNSVGLMMQLVKYTNSNDCTVRFVDDGTIVEKVRYGHFLDGGVAHPTKRKYFGDSINELSMLFYLKDFGFSKKSYTKEPIKGQEIDLYNEALKIGIEYDGSAFHGEKDEKDNEKIKKCNEAGIRLLRIREDKLPCRTVDDYHVDKRGRCFSVEINRTMQSLFDELRKYPELSNIPIPDVIKDKQAICKLIGELHCNVQRIGEAKVMSNGQIAKIVSYIDWNNYTVKFEDGTVVEGTAYCNFETGSITNSKYTIYDFKHDQKKYEFEKKYIGTEVYIKNVDTMAKVVAVKFQKRKLDCGQTRVKWLFSMQYKNGEIEDVSKYMLDHPEKITPQYYITETRLHARRKSTNDGWAEVIEYISYSDITIKFDTGEIRQHISWGNFDRGLFGKRAISKKAYKRIGNADLVGTRKRSSCGEWMTVIEYNRCDDITVKFDSGEIRYHITRSNFERGNVGRYYKSKEANKKKKEEKENVNEC